jgi:hypothetical protein
MFSETSGRNSATRCKVAENVYKRTICFLRMHGFINSADPQCRRDRHVDYSYPSRDGSTFRNYSHGIFHTLSLLCAYVCIMRQVSVILPRVSVVVITKIKQKSVKCH